MVFYFTGTGNCLYIAKKLEAEPISIPQVIHSRDLDFTDSSIGIVAPVYGHQVPPMVREFLSRATFHTDYLYILLTYGCIHGGASELALDLCKELNISVSYINVILMVDNWLPGFDMDEQRKMDKNVDGQFNVILADLKARKRMISPVTDKDRAAHQSFLTRKSTQPPDAWKRLLRFPQSCSGCGICSMVCPSGSVRMEDGRPVYIPDNCQTCLACINACPSKAITLTVPEKNPTARYRNEHISLSEIIRANSQAQVPPTGDDISAK